MEVFAVIVLTVIGLILYSKRSNATATAQIERSTGLENWRFEEGDSDGSTEWVLHFPTMRLNFRSSSYESRLRLMYLARRTPLGVWERCLSEQSRREQIQEHESDLAKMKPDAPLRKSVEERLASFHEAAKWEPIPEAFTPSIETAYQRYTRQG